MVLTMRLLDLEPEWLDRYDPATHGMYRNNDVKTPATYPIIRPGDEEFFPTNSIDQSRAQGILFLCPVCFKKNGGPVGTESVLVWFKDRGVPDAAEPLPRWTATGSCFADLTLAPSIDMGPGHWHGHVTNGEIT